MGRPKHTGVRADNAPDATSIKSDPEFLQAGLLQARYRVSLATINRWVKDPTIGFPPPLYFGRFRFWKITELESWEARQPRSQGAAQ